VPRIFTAADERTRARLVCARIRAGVDSGGGAGGGWGVERGPLCVIPLLVNFRVLVSHVWFRARFTDGRASLPDGSLDSS